MPTISCKGISESFNIICFFSLQLSLQRLMRVDIHVFADTGFVPISTVFHREIISGLFACEFHSEFLDQLKWTNVFRDNCRNLLVIVSSDYQDDITVYLGPVIIFSHQVQQAVMLANISNVFPTLLLISCLNLSVLQMEEIVLYVRYISRTLLGKGNKSTKSLTYQFSKGLRLLSLLIATKPNCSQGNLAHCHFPTGLFVGACEQNKNGSAFSIQLSLIADLGNKLTFFLKLQ